MSKFSRAAATSQALSIVAMEEASRQGLREADLEHLLLALVVNDQPAGAVLRSLGATLAETRTAVQEHHRVQLESLGIDAALPYEGRIVYAETAGYSWSRRAVDLISRSAGRGHNGDASEVLRLLVAEPSGLIAALLARLDTTPDAVLQELDVQELSPQEQAPQDAATPENTLQRRPGVAAVAEVFIPAPAEEVWAFISDPARIPEWHASIAVVEGAVAEVTAVESPTVEGAVWNWQPGTTWSAQSAITDRAGKAVQLKPSQRQQGIELVEISPQQFVAWRTTYPNLRASRPTLSELRIVVAPGGTRLTVTTSWPPLRGSRRIVGILLMPFQRFLVWILAFQTAGAVSRALRPETPGA